MSLSVGLIAAVTPVYMAILFAVISYGDRRRTPLSPRLRAWVYSLFLAVYYTSWTFFDTVGQATDQLWPFLPIYFRPVLLILFALWVLQKVITISKQENITFIVGFITVHYGKSQALAIAMVLICMVGALPYIALQPKGIVLGVNLLISSGANSTGIRTQDAALIVSLALAPFTIVFGTRSLDVTEHHRSMVLAIVFESLIKFTVSLAVGIFVIFGLCGSFVDLSSQARAAPQLADYWEETVHQPVMLLQTSMAMTAVMYPPRQFHVTMVENIGPHDLNLAHWVFPIYLVLATSFVVSIVLASRLHLLTGVVPDSFVISLPLAETHPALALLIFIGSASAATGMVIVTGVALLIMVSSDILLPQLLRRRERDAERPSEAFHHWLLTVRRVSIAVILLFTYVAYRLLGPGASLTIIGQIAFVAIAQLGSAMIGVLYWKRANRRGVFIGLAVGSLLRVYTLVPPVAAKGPDWLPEHIPGLTWPAGGPFGLLVELLIQGVLISLTSNFILFGPVLVLSRTHMSEHWQTSRFVGREISQRQNSCFISIVRVEDLLMLATRFVGEERVRQSFIRFAYRQGKDLTPNQTVDNEWVTHIERLLAGALDASSARAVVKATVEGRKMQVEDVVRIADKASEVLQSSRTLLQDATENITQGTSVVDRSLHLVVWSHRYLGLFEYPDELIYVGRSITDIIRCNAGCGLCGLGDPDMHAVKRLYRTRQGTPHTFERLFPSGRVIELIGNPIPGGGFVMSFTGITAYREAEQGPKGANESLEQRAQERTQEFSQLNQELNETKGNAGVANQSKTHFLVAVSHGLMQPLNAARLFSAAPAHQGALPGEVRDLVQHLDSSLRLAEDLITGLLDIPRLESDRVSAEHSPFPLDNLYGALGVEFRVLAQEQGLHFCLHGSQLRVDNDIKLPRHILQSFLANAFRYTRGHVLLGVRREGGYLHLEVWDQRPGIPPDKQRVIFEEFKRLGSHQTRAEKGLGLGLAIADRLCKVLGHLLEICFWPGKGSVFSIHAPLARQAPPALVNGHKAESAQALSDARMLCVDNEGNILIGMGSLFGRWDCQVRTTRSREERATLLGNEMHPQLALIDYHLGDGETGTQLVAWLCTRLGKPVPGVAISAGARPELMAEIHAAGLDYLSKPVKSAVLRALFSRHLSLC